jgi:fucose permease
MRRSAGGNQTAALNYAAMAQHGMILLLVGPLVPNLMASFGVGESMVGVLLGMGSLGFVAGPLFAGALIDRINVRAALVVGFGIELVLLVAFGAAPVFSVAVAANLLLHLGASFIETSANVMPSLRQSSRSAHAAMSLVHMFFSVGAFVGPFLIGLYLDATGAWRPIMYFALVPTGVLGLWSFAIRLPKAPRRVEPRSNPLAHVQDVIRMPHALLGAATLLLYVGAEVGISSWVVHYLQKQLGLSTVASASGLSILWMSIMVGRFANSLLGNRFSSRSLVTVSGLVGAAGVVLFLFAEGMLAAYALLVWIGLCLAGIFPNVMGELNNRVPDKIGTVTAVMAMGASLGAAIFQWFVGFLAETASLTVAFIVPAVLLVLLVATFQGAVRASRLPLPGEVG